MSGANKTEKDSLWFNSDVFMHQVGKGSVGLVSFLTNDTS